MSYGTLSSPWCKVIPDSGGGGGRWCHFATFNILHCKMVSHYNGSSCVPAAAHHKCHSHSSLLRSETLTLIQGPLWVLPEFVLKSACCCDSSRNRQFSKTTYAQAPKIMSSLLAQHPAGQMHLKHPQLGLISHGAKAQDCTRTGSQDQDLYSSQVQPGIPA